MEASFPISGLVGPLRLNRRTHQTPIKLRTIERIFQGFEEQEDVLCSIVWRSKRSFITILWNTHICEAGHTKNRWFLRRYVTRSEDNSLANLQYLILSGFIALAVCLVLIIIVSCTAVYFLLRDQKTFDEEQTRRRNRYHSDTDASSHPRKRTRAPISWSRRMAALFGRRDTNDDTQARSNINQVKMRRGSGEHRWMRTGSRDDWESDSSEERRHTVSQLGVREAPSPSFSHVYSTRSIIQPTPVSRTTSDSTSSVRFDLHAVRGLGYPDRSLSPHPTLPNIHSQLSSPSYSPISSPVTVRTTSPESMPSGMTLDDDGPHPAPQSGAFTRTFPGGSKFIEDL